MSEYDPSLAGIVRRAVRRLSRHGDDEASAAPTAGSVLDSRHARHLPMLHDIAAFLAAHELEMNAQTLSAAHDYLNGSDSTLVRRIDGRVRRHEPVTADWLARASGSDSRAEELATLTALMQRLETSLDAFGQTTSQARSATSEYNSALEQHVDELEQVSKAGAVISELATIARVMLERTREIEGEMSRSEAETRALRRSLDQARRSAERDHLTGLPNRRAFENLLDTETAAARSAQEHLCVAFCDIDNFKRINDTHGHDAGDRVLRVVAQALARISDDRCHVARHGGEEFVVLLRGKTLPEAWETLDNARVDLAEKRLVNRSTDVPFGKVTFSGGLADVFAHGDARAALKAADQALYRAKEEGRNRIVVAPRPTPPPAAAPAPQG